VGDDDSRSCWERRTTMPLDDRLRHGLHAEAAGIEPDVERHLERVRGRSRHMTAPVGRLAVAGIVAIAVVAVVRISSVDPVSVVMSMFEPAPTIAPVVSDDPVDPSDPLAGTYRLHLDDTDAVVAESGMAGDWEVTLAANSAITLTAPDGYSAALEESVTGYVYAIRDDRLYTNLFARHLAQGCAGSGTYRWHFTDGRLALEGIEDMCLARLALLASQPWTPVTE
jgi:hypothetical protein